MILLVCTAGCRIAAPPPLVHVRLAGAQIATELVESWLLDARAARFAVIRAANPTWSDAGFTALARGACDIACTDRPISQRELQAFAPDGAAGDPPGSAASPDPPCVQGYRVGLYGFALYVHPDNPLESIFAGHLKLVFERQLTDWQDLAGPQRPQCQGPITLYGPQKMSRGGLLLMQHARVWFGDPTWHVLDTDEQIVAQVAADPQALGFAGIGYDGPARYLGIRLRRTGPPAFPSLEEIEREEYALAKVIHVYFIDPPAGCGPPVLDWLFSADGRRAIAATHVWPVDRSRAAAAPTP